MSSERGMSTFFHSRVRRFSSTLDSLLTNLSNTGRGRKQALSMLIDGSLAGAVLWLAYTLRHGQPFGDFRSTWHVFLIVPVGTVMIFAAVGIYRWVIRSTNRRLFIQLAKGAVLAGGLVMLTTYLLPPERGNPRSLFAIYGALLLIASAGARLFWQGLFDAGRRGEPVAVYGAGGGRSAARRSARRRQRAPSRSSFSTMTWPTAGRPSPGCRSSTGGTPTCARSFFATMSSGSSSPCRRSTVKRTECSSSDLSRSGCRYRRCPASTSWCPGTPASTRFATSPSRTSLAVPRWHRTWT